MTRSWFAKGWVGLLLAGWLALGTAWAEPVSWYVVTNEVATSDGTSWATAFTNVQDSLDSVTPGVTNTIHLAGHTFDLTNALSWVDQTNVILRGGYDAATGNHDPANQVTILRQTASGHRVLLMVELEDCRLEHVTLTGGRVDDHGGGIYSLNSIGVTIEGCVISNNLANTTARSTRYGGGIYVSGGSVSVVSSRIEGNTVETTGGNTYNADMVGGGLYLAGGSLRVEHSTVISNISHAGGTSRHAFSAGVGHASGSSLTLRNCLIYGNQNLPASAKSRFGAGVILETGGLIESCTIVGNRMYNEADQGAGLRVNGGAVTNTIVYGNKRDGLLNDIGFGASASEADHVFYSLAPEMTLTEAPNHNMADDPLFRESDAGDFRLQQGSPAIDAGINQPWMIGTVDLAGLPRIMKGTVDMGCYETVPPRGTLFLFR